MIAMVETGAGYERIWAIVAQIPKGRVATYGQVATLAGLGRRARMVGYALHYAPPDRSLPWHRVINAQGQISFPSGSEDYCRQRRRLEREQVQFVNDRIDLARFRWRPQLDDQPDEYLHHIDTD